MKLFGVTGNPILHSKSPLIHQAWLDHTGIDGKFVRLSAETAREAIKLAKELSMQGLNVSSPYKEEVLEFLSEYSKQAAALQATNTIVFKDAAALGHNTDPEGVISALSGFEVRNKKCCVLGNGGAAAAAMTALHTLGADVTVLARNTAKLGAIALHSESACEAFRAASFIVNTLPASAALPERFTFHPGAVLVDAVYAADSAASKQAQMQGVRKIPGTKWLVGQARTGFKLFTGIDAPDSDPLEAPANPKKAQVFLTGMMGSGKSSALSELSKLGYRCLDLDAAIESSQNRTISDIFLQDGEAAFREIEHRVLLQAAAQSSYQIIACGGGTGTFPNNRGVLQNGTVFWVWCRPEVLVERLHSAAGRPLLSGDIPSRTEELLKSRFNDYARSCDIIVSSSDRTADELAQRIHFEISSAGVL